MISVDRVEWGLIKHREFLSKLILNIRTEYGKKIDNSSGDVILTEMLDYYFDYEILSSIRIQQFDWNQFSLNDKLYSLILYPDSKMSKIPHLPKIKNYSYFEKFFDEYINGKDLEECSKSLVRGKHKDTMLTQIQNGGAIDIIKNAFLYGSNSNEDTIQNVFRNMLTVLSSEINIHDIGSLDDLINTLFDTNHISVQSRKNKFIPYVKYEKIYSELYSDVFAMNYSDLKTLRIYFSEALNLKVCPYCNRNYINDRTTLTQKILRLVKLSTLFQNPNHHYFHFL